MFSAKIIKLFNKSYQSVMKQSLNAYSLSAQRLSRLPLCYIIEIFSNKVRLIAIY